MSIPSPRLRNRRESVTGVTPAQIQRTHSLAGVVAAEPISATAPMRPRANTISSVDGAAMEMIASVNSSVARGVAAQDRHLNLAGLSVYALSYGFGDLSAVLDQRGMQYGLPELDTAQISGSDLDNNDLSLARPMVGLNLEFDFEGLFFGPGPTINPNAIHYNGTPQSMGMNLDLATPFPQIWNDAASTQDFNDSRTR